MMTSMGVKTITISIEAYNALVREKRPGESFSDVILRLIRSRGDLMELAGSWSDLDDEEVGEFLKNVRKAWEFISSRRHHKGEWILRNHRKR